MTWITGCLVVLSVVLQLAFGTGTCPDPFYLDVETNKCYHMGSTAVTWAKARTECMKYDADLLTVKSASSIPLQNKFFEPGPHLASVITSELLESPYLGYWLGLNDRRNVGFFRWNDEQENATYFNWAPNEPSARSPNFDKKCAALMKRDGVVGWVTKPCHAGCVYVCERLTNEDLAIYKTENAYWRDVTCPGMDWVRVTNRRVCIQMQSELKKQQEASDFCAREADNYDIEGTFKLLNVGDFEINDFISGKLGRKDHWISANDKLVEGEYRDGTNEGALIYLPWQRRTTRSDSTDCVVISQGDLGIENGMIEQDCDAKYPFICEYNPPPPIRPISESREKVCPEGWSKYAASETCFKAMDVKKTMWHSAREECQHLDGDLAIIPNQDTLDFLKGIVTINRYWIGLKDKDKNGKFSWLGQDAETEFEAWRNRPRNLGGDEYCVELIGAKEGQWNDKSCNAKKHFICQKPATLADG